MASFQQVLKNLNKWFYLQKCKYTQKRRRITYFEWKGGKDEVSQNCLTSVGNIGRLYGRLSLSVSSSATKLLHFTPLQYAFIHNCFSNGKASNLGVVHFMKFRWPYGAVVLSFFGSTAHWMTQNVLRHPYMPNLHIVTQ